MLYLGTLERQSCKNTHYKILWQILSSDSALISIQCSFTYPITKNNNNIEREREEKKEAER